MATTPMKAADCELAAELIASYKGLQIIKSSQCIRIQIYGFSNTSQQFGPAIFRGTAYAGLLDNALALIAAQLKTMNVELPV